VLFLLLILALSGMALTVIIWVGTLFLQGYYYTQPTEGIAWQAPVAGFAIGLFLTLWCMLMVNSADPNAYETLFRFEHRVDKFKQPVKDLWVVNKASKEPVHYTLKKKWQGGVVTSEYVEAQSGRPYSPSGVEEIIIKENGETVRFLPASATKGAAYREFVDESGWTIREYPQSGPTGMPEAFRWGRFLTSFFFNSAHLVLWFVCLWALVRFQWSHALGLAVVMWVIMTVAVLPMLFEQTALRAQTASPREKAELRVVQPCLV
jgi:hypothetical protein